ncbi:MAG: thioesterase family protein [Ignavibacteriae bacterium]|nr:thioesterase family protein [Ignavibacteriota bacterium]
MVKAELKYRVLYSHTDVMGIANNERYLEYFEAGRNELMRSRGFPYTELEKLKIGLPLIEAKIKYIAGAKYDDELRITAEMGKMQGVRLTINYKIFVGEKLIAEGYTEHAFVKLGSLKPVRPPEEFINIFK